MCERVSTNETSFVVDVRSDGPARTRVVERLLVGAFCEGSTFRFDLPIASLRVARNCGEQRHQPAGRLALLAGEDPTIMARSNSAKTPSICTIVRPAGVLVSKGYK